MPLGIMDQGISGETTKTEMRALKAAKNKLQLLKEDKKSEKQDNQEPSEMFDFDIPHESGNMSESIWNEKDHRQLQNPDMVEVDSDYFAVPESGDISSSEEEDQESSQYDAVLVKQCQLKRARFQYQGQEAHAIENFGGKSMAPVSSRAQIKQRHRLD